MWPLRPDPFGVTRNGEAIETLPVRDTVTTGIDYASLLPGLVPLYEEREAAVYGHYRWRDWQNLPAEERAAAVAHFRLHRLIDLHQHDALNTAMERRRQMAARQ